MKNNPSQISTVGIPRNPITGRQGKVRYTAIRDAFFGTPGEWSFQRDPHDGHLWLDPRPCEDHIPEIYSRYYTHTSDYQAAHKNSIWEDAVEICLADKLGYSRPLSPKLTSRLVSLLPSVSRASTLDVLGISSSESGRLLDFGCGNGKFLNRMKRAGWEIVGVEPDPAAASGVSQRLKCPVYASLDELTRKCDPLFDIITINHVIEHLVDPTYTLMSLRELLSPAGKIIITTPNAESLGLKIFGEHWRGLEPPRHFNIFSKKSLSSCIEMAGLTVIHASTESRLARGLYYSSSLARTGYLEIESQPSKSRVLTKFSGYLFQVLEHTLMLINGDLGEEIFCICTHTSGQPDDH